MLYRYPTEGRRPMGYLLPRSQLTNLLMGRARLEGNDGERLRIPAGARVCDLGPAFQLDGIVIVMEHESFEPAPDDSIPIANYMCAVYCFPDVAEEVADRFERQCLFQTHLPHLWEFGVEHGCPCPECQAKAPVGVINADEMKMVDVRQWTAADLAKMFQVPAEKLKVPNAEASAEEGKSWRDRPPLL